MKGDDSYMTHPKNDCFWSEWEFDQPDVAAWNRRATLPAAQPTEALYAAVGKLIKAKGRFHTEQNYVALVAAYDAVPAVATGGAVADKLDA